MKNAYARYLGFTLIELLVVVLIIGILAAVALPQYQRAIWKSRAVGTLLFARALRDAQDAYYMANGTFTGDATQLDINLPPGCSSVANTSTTTGYVECPKVRYELVLALSSTTGWIRTEPNNCPVRTPHNYYKRCLQINLPYRNAKVNSTYTPNLDSWCEPWQFTCGDNESCMTWARNMCKNIANNETQSTRTGREVYYLK